MIRQLYSNHFAVLAAGVVAAVAMSTPSALEAAEPASTDLVSEASITANGWQHNIDSRTAFAGIEECEGNLLGEDATFRATFTTDHVTPDGQWLFDSETSFGGAFHYSNERGESRVNCLNNDGEVASECTEVDEDDYTVDDGGREISFSVPLETMLDLEEDDCQAGEIDRSYRIRLELRDDEQSDYRSSEVRAVVDLIRPDSPALTDAFTTENTISVEFDPSESDDVATHAVVYSSEEFSEGDSIDDLSGPEFLTGEESGDIDVDLDPGSTVYVAVVARDLAGNWSFASAPMETTVIETDGFWDYYVDHGGSEQGTYGCMAAGGTTAPVVLTWLAALMSLLVVGRLIAGRREVQKQKVRIRNDEVGRR